MSFTHKLSDDELKAACDIVAEGRIVHAYRDLVPGIGRQIAGDHFLFEKATVIDGTERGHSVISQFPGMGFWVTRRNHAIEVGDDVRVYLRLIANESAGIAFMPLGSDDSVRLKEGGIGLMNCRAKPGQLRSLHRKPLRENFITIGRLQDSICDLEAIRHPF